MLDPRTTPIRLNLKKDQSLDIEWQDGLRSVYPISLLRTMCPCAACKVVREESGPQRNEVVKKHVGGKLGLAILPGNFADPLRVISAELVGNYALRIDWSDKHGSGIYSFQYLREISREKKEGTVEDS
jgi:DUF971 family protein